VTDPVGLTGSVRNWYRRVVLSPPFLPVCFSVYLGLRALTLFIRPFEQASDSLWYFERAVSIASGQGFAEDGIATAFWPVGWPGFLGMVFSVTSPAMVVGQIANLGLSALVFELTIRPSDAIFADRIVGRGAVLILTMYPNQIGYVPVLSAEIYFECILLCGVLCLTKRTDVAAFLAGIVFGVATLTKAQSVLLPGLILGCVFLMAPSRQSLLQLGRTGIIAYVALVVLVAPWTWRNYSVLHAFIPVSTNGGWTLLTGNNPAATGTYQPNTVLADGISHAPELQVEMDRLARDRAIAWIEANPVRFILLMPRKLYHLWAKDGEAELSYLRGFALYDRYAVVFHLTRWLNQAYYAAIVLLALPSLWLLVRRRRDVPPWAVVGVAVFAHLSLVSMVFSGQSRFHVSVMPFMAIYAGWTIARADGRDAGEQGRMV
jgi:hypothetical protein